ncbi:MAG TPA: hypothetical protein VNM69_00510 [Bacillus sp. (in: firmicutes)]|uniref:hypothetical protein n=1 Tax=Bacillus litorisediminis TaxID=2922713 RepID=UPI001FAF67BC|nr:hypothetical protein [Bacillus litorisediminis]HWO74377.1 hypothetical protein [Bacillus sp. (in: firmicutes)]
MISAEVLEIIAKDKAESRKGLNFYDRDPGAGAVDFARQFVIGKGDRAEILIILSELLDGGLHDPNDRRVKTCDYCGYLWRDESLRNNRRTCSDECKKNIKTLQRRQQRERQELLNPEPKPRKRKLEDDYVYWLEYPYWTNEYSMIKVGWKYEPPRKYTKLDTIENRRGLWGNGNRRKSYVNYDEREAEESYDDRNWNDHF